MWPVHRNGWNPIFRTDINCSHSYSFSLIIVMLLNFLFPVSLCHEYYHTIFHYFLLLFPIISSMSFIVHPSISDNVSKLLESGGSPLPNNALDTQSQPLSPYPISQLLKLYQQWSVWPFCETIFTKDLPNKSLKYDSSAWDGISILQTWSSLEVAPRLLDWLNLSGLLNRMSSVNPRDKTAFKLEGESLLTVVIILFLTRSFSREQVPYIWVLQEVFSPIFISHLAL